MTLPRMTAAPSSAPVAELADRFVVEFDDRPDGGPRLVGPFDDRAEAQAHVDRLVELWPDKLALWVSSVCPLPSPATSRRASLLGRLEAGARWRG